MQRYLHPTKRLKNRAVAIRAIARMFDDVTLLEEGMIEYGGKRYFVRASNHPTAIKIADDAHPNYGDDHRHAQTEAMMLFRDMLDGRCTVYIVPYEAAYMRMDAGYGLAWKDASEIKIESHTERNSCLPEVVYG